MKKVKKLMAMMLAIVMVLAMNVTAFAAAPTSGTLTVSITDGSLQNQKIYLFKLFDYTETDPHTYTANANYKETLKTVLSVTTDEDYDLYSAIAGKGENDSEEVQKFANDFTKAVISNGSITGTKDTDYFVSDAIDSDGKEYQFTNVAPGYYLVYLGGSLSVQSSLVTVNGDTPVDLKSELPTPDKQAYNAEGTTVVDNVKIGDVLTYKVTAKVPDISAYNPDTYVFKLHDTLSDGLTFVADSTGAVATSPMTVGVTVDGTDVSPALTATITGQNMELDLSQVVKDAQTDNIGKDIVVTYYAQVNEDAVVDNTKNSAKLEYSNDPTTGDTGESLPDVVTTPTFSIYVHKYEQGKTDEYLDGAQFKLYNDVSCSDDNEIKVVDKTNSTYAVAKDQDTAASTAMETSATAIAEGYNLQINGLAEGTYYLKETATPDGFNELENPLKIEIERIGTGDDTTYTITVDDAIAPNNIVGVENMRGALLPSTGGTGTVIFTVAGLVLILGVGASFVISRKRNDA